MDETTVTDAVTTEEAPAEATVEVVETEQPNPLFAPEAEEADEPSVFDAEEAEGAEAAPEEPEAEDKPAIPPGVQKRISQLARQKKEARRAEARAREEAETLRKRAEEAGQFEAAVRRAYARFKDPIKAFEGDSAWMDKLEEMKGDPRVQAAIQVVNAALQNGATVSEAKVEKSDTPEIPEPVAKLLAQTGAEKIETTLKGVGVKAGFLGILRDHIQHKLGANAAAADKATILGAAKEYVEKYGLSEADVVEKPAKAAPAAARQAVATPKSTKAAITTTREAKPGEKREESPRTMSEWEARRNERLRAFIES